MAGFLNKLTGIKDEGDVVARIQNVEAEASAPAEKDWLDENYEGQLSVDVYGTPKELVIKSTIAGVTADDIDISINNDMITIRGERKPETDEDIEEYFNQECYWGGFSRSIILPVEVDADNVSAALKNGVLTIRLTKVKKSKSVSIKIKEE